MTDIEELKRLAGTATAGPWKASMTDVGLCVIKVDGNTYSETICKWAGDHPSRMHNMEFIAAANPSAILSLISRLEKAEAEVKLLQEAVNSIIDFHNLPLAAKRPDIWHRVLSKAAKALETP